MAKMLTWWCCRPTRFRCQPMRCCRPVSSWRWSADESPSRTS